MTSKEIFLSINKEILLKKNKTLSYSSKEEERILNYRNGIRIIILNESRLREIEFFTELQVMYKKMQVPLLSAYTTLVLYRKFLINKDIFKSLCYLATKLKEKSFSSELPYWELVIGNFSFIDRGSFVSEKIKLDLFIQISSQLFLMCGYESFQLIFRYVLNYSIETVKFCWSIRQMGNFIPAYILSQSPVSNNIWKACSFLNEMNAPTELYEVILFQYIQSTPTSFLHRSNYYSFFEYLYRRIPVTTIQRESLRSSEILFEVYNINPKIFELIDFKQVNKEYVEILNSSPWSENRIGEYSFFLVEKMFKVYGISVYFAKAHIELKMTIIEKAWFNDVLSGKNLIYSANLPFKLSKKVAHEFNTSHQIYSNSVTEGLVRTALFSEVQDMAFATAIITKIRSFSETDFWIKTMVLLYRKGLRADTIELNELYDYIHYQVYQLERKIDFTTKKLSNLIDESNQWHLAIHFAKVKKRLRLKRLPIFKIKPYFLERNNCRYVIKQLKTNYELAIEGEQMKHCVFFYTYDCLNSGSYIFSLKNIIKNTDSKESTEITMITIEVNNNRIVQKMGEFNRPCNQLEDDLIEEWAKLHHLTL